MAEHKIPDAGCDSTSLSLRKAREVRKAGLSLQPDFLLHGCPLRCASSCHLGQPERATQDRTLNVQDACGTTKIGWEISNVLTSTCGYVNEMPAVLTC